MARTRCVFGAVAVVAAGAISSPGFAVVLGTTDTFEDTTVMGWGGGTTISNSPGGQGGDNDLFLLVSSNGMSAGAGSKLATHNFDPRWTGNYLAAGVTAIQADMLNIGSSALQMRLVLFSGGNRWTSTNAFTLTPGADWQRVTFAISAADLTRVLGSGTFAGSMGAVDRIMFRHDGASPSSGGESITGTIGVDNISAVPAPAGVAPLAVGVLMVAGRRRRVSARVLRGA